jgi:crotonobetainyl-CoA:carnitine CoA-transferase CaiB-like acyl-CoA transferase
VEDEKSKLGKAGSRPLDNMVVIEIGQNVAAPFAGLILGHLGAEVIKIERPNGGDPTREWGPPFTSDGSVAYQTFNYNKRSLVLDLKDGEDIARLRRLIADRADVVIQNLRPGAAQKLNLGDDVLRSNKPSLIYCNMSAFGSFGPLALKPGYDPLMQAFAGLMSVTGHEQDEPVRVGVSLVDMGAGLWAALGILAALLRRRETGLGCVVDTSLYEVALNWMSLPIATFLASGDPPRRHGSGMGLVAPYQAVATSEGHLMIAAGNDALFAKLANALGLPDLADDPAYASNRDRVANRHILLDRIAERAAQFSTGELACMLDRAGVPNAPVRGVDEVARDEQTIASRMVARAGNGLEFVGLPIRLDGERPTAPLHENISSAPSHPALG